MEPLRINIPQSEWVRSAIDRLAQKAGKSYHEILRDAIALERWVNETREQANGPQRPPES